MMYCWCHPITGRSLKISKFGEQYLKKFFVSNYNCAKKLILTLQCHQIHWFGKISKEGGLSKHNTPHHPDDAIQPKPDADDSAPTHYTAQNISRLPFSHITPYKTMILQKLMLKQGLHWAPKKHQQCRVNVLHCLKELSEKVKELGEQMKLLSKTRANCYRKVCE